MRKLNSIDPDDMMFIFVCSMIIMGIIYVWYIGMPLWFALPLTLILLFSMYYQVMVWRRQTSFAMIGMELQDRMINEFAYQTMKRGHTIKVKVIEDNPDDPQSDSHFKIVTNMSKSKKALVKAISIFFVILCPAWNYREFEGEDKIMER